MAGPAFAPGAKPDLAALLKDLSPEDRKAYVEGNLEGMSTPGLQIIADARKALAPNAATDFMRSALAGPGSALSGALTLPGKAVLGLTHGMMDPKMASMLGRKLKEVEGKTNERTGGDYAPQTDIGRYTKTGVAGAMAAPGRGMGASALTGLLGGLGAEATRDLGGGEAGAAIASMLPGAAYTVGRGLTPGGAQRNLRRAANQMEPGEVRDLKETLAASRSHAAGLMPWQAAPEGSTLRNLGTRTALTPDATRIQKGLRDQRWIDDDWAMSRAQSFPNDLDELVRLSSRAQEDQALRGRHAVPSHGSSGASEALAVALNRPYLAGSMPLRELAGRAHARKYDEALSGTDLSSLRKVMAQNPQLDSLIVALQTLLKPAQVGAVGVPGQEEK